MANDPIYDEVNLTTHKEIYPDVIQDEFFRNAPFLAYMRENNLEPFRGGAFTQTVFTYKPMIGGPLARGGNMNITKRQTLAGTQFEPRQYYVSIPEFKEDIQIFNKGPEAVFKMIDVDLRNGMNTISAIVAVALSNHGQGAGGSIVGNRPTDVNGWIEALSDGIVPSWDGSIFGAYGTAPRNAVIGSTLNSVPFWCGDQNGNAGTITYNILEESYQDSSVGPEEPNLGVGNKAMIAYFKERMQTQQRFMQERDPVWGVQGIKFNSAMVLKDEYFPSARYGVNDPDLGNYLTSTFTSPNIVLPTISNMPQNKVLTVGEVFAWFNTDKWIFRISDDPEFGFGFSGFVPSQDSTKVVGQIKASIILECTSPRMQKVLYGINS